MLQMAVINFFEVLIPKLLDDIDFLMHIALAHKERILKFRELPESKKFSF